MKKVISIFVLALTLALPAIVQAQSGAYVTPKFLMTFQNTGTLSRSGGSGFGMDTYSQFTLGGAIAAGYDLYVQHQIPIRLELEGAMRGNSETTWTGYRGEIKGTWNSTTLLANVYWDFHNETMFTPYIGAGLGLAFNYAGYDIKHAGNNFSMDDRFTNFAWNLGAGAAVELNEQMSVDLGYRFLSLGENKVEATSGGTHYKIKTSPYNHEIMLGLRIGF